MLGPLIKNARLKAKLTQEKVALRAGIDRSFFSEVERDIKHPSVDMLVKICRALETSAADMVRELERTPTSKSRK